jgi:hypothetical protein
MFKNLFAWRCLYDRLVDHDGEFKDSIPVVSPGRNHCQYWLPTQLFGSDSNPFSVLGGYGQHDYKVSIFESNNCCSD